MGTRRNKSKRKEHEKEQNAVATEKERNAVGCMEELECSESTSQGQKSRLASVDSLCAYLREKTDDVNDDVNDYDDDDDDDDETPVVTSAIKKLKTFSI